MAMSTQETTYEFEGRLLEVCTCNVLCPCWVGENPDGNGTCDAITAYYVDRGSIRGIDVSDRCIAMSAHIPGNVLSGDWKVAVLVDDRCTDEQQQALLEAFTGQLGGPLADLAGLVGEVVTVERTPTTFEVVDGKGYIKLGDVAEARLAPFVGPTGEPTTLHESIFSTIPGSPAFVGKAESFRRDGSRHGLPDVRVNGQNAIQGLFRFSA
jgi:hypothetical protein